MPLCFARSDVGSLDFRNSSDVYFTEKDLLLSADEIAQPLQLAHSGTGKIELASDEIERWYRERYA